MVRTKVFVGNLSFNTKENELAKEFEVGGKVISANIITRGPRSLGYGFVEMDNEEDAENAVRLLHKKEIDGRAINVEVAKPRVEGENGQADKGAANGQETGAPNAGRGGRGRGRGGRGRGSSGRGRGGAASAPTGEGEVAEGQQGQEGEARRGRGGRRGGSSGRGRGGARRPREEKQGEENRTPSTTTLFVANLPFSFDNDQFGKILKDGGLAFKTAHVVKRKTGSSKGYGFIEFDNEGDQQKALAALNNKQFEGRELVVKVALTENRPDGTVVDVAATTQAPTEQKA